MSEPVPQQSQPSPWRKVLGCLIGLVGGGLAFLSLLIGVCAGAYGELQKDQSLVALVVVIGAVGIALLFAAIRLWRRP